MGFRQMVRHWILIPAFWGFESLKPSLEPLAYRCVRGDFRIMGGPMIELGKEQCLNVVKKTDFGVYLGTEEDKVLLPGKMVPSDIEVGDALTVFVYRDSSDRLIATTRQPKIKLGEIAKLKVSQIARIGAFLDWGLEKDLFLPYKEQTTHVSEGDECLVALYIDKSDRLAATMRVYHYLVNGSGYVKDSAVEGTVIEVNPERGIYVAVDDKYFGMIPKNEVYGHLHVGDTFHGRVSNVREDGKLTISLKQKAYIQMDEDSSVILSRLKDNGGSLPFNDKSSPDAIKEYFDMSKNAFKRGVGRLLKEGHIRLEDDHIELADM